MPKGKSAAGKSGKGGKGGRPKSPKKAIVAVEVDWAADEFFQPTVALVIVEHDTACFVYGEQLAQLHAELLATFPERTFRMLVNQRSRLGESAVPRAGSFEIWLAQNARCAPELLWSGVQRGPPRRLKFPRSNAQLWPQVRRIVSRIYRQPDADDELEDLPDD